MICAVPNRRLIQPSQAIVGPKISTGFDPTSISGLMIWLDAADIATLWQDSTRTTPVAANSDPIGAWDDKSGNASHLTQATSGKRPIYASSGTGVLYDGADDCLTRTITLNSSMSVFIVMKVSGTAGMIIEHSDNVNLAADGGFWLYGTTGQTLNNRYTNPGGQSSKEYASNWAVDDVLKVVTVEYGTTHASHKMRVDGSEVSLSSVSTDNIAAQDSTEILNLGSRANGGSLPVTGTLHEVLIYNPQISSTDRDAVEAYLLAKW